MKKYFTLLAAGMIAANAMAYTKTFTITVGEKQVSFNMIFVESGTFIMGVQESTEGSETAKPAHSVTLTKDFYIAETEVTQALWEAVMGYKPTETATAERLWSTENGLGDNKPAYFISWYDCNDFIAQLNARITDMTFRMPTEAEWEYAARGRNTQNTRYSGSNAIGDVAWYEENNNDTFGTGAKNVATLQANALGIYDMSGNVYEWCSDWYGKYTADAQTDPTGPATGTERVIRGGYWNGDASGCYVSHHDNGNPSNGTKFIGLRLAMGAPKYTITTEAGAGGSVTEGKEYSEGKTITLTATPNAGCKFVKWNDGNTDNPRIVTVIGNATYKAEFAAIITVDTDCNISNLTWGNNSTDFINCDIIVTNGATLTCDESNKKVANMRVENGGKLVVDGVTLGITGTFTAHSQGDVQPQILTKNEGAITYSKFQFVKRIPADRYYFFSLPFACATSSVTIDGEVAVYNTNWNIRYYDGAGFAANPSNTSFWKVDNTGEIQTKQGYTIGVAAPRPDIYRELVFTPSNGTIDFSLDAFKTIAVAANGATGTQTQYSGWNFVMNPYTSNFNGDTDGLKISSNVLAYVTIPDPGQNKTYTTKLINDADDLPPFFGFFVQVVEAGNVVFTPGNPHPPEEILLARRANGSKIVAEPLLVGVRLSNGAKEDETTLVIGEQFTEAYEIGSDLMKMIGYADKPQLYTFDTETKYAFHSLNETAATQVVHPLGVYLPAESEYTFSLKPIRGEREVEAVYLYDYEADACVDLMQGDYTFTSGYLNTESRFALSPLLAPGITTDTSLGIADGVKVWQTDDLQLTVSGLKAGNRVRIFDLQGYIVSEWTATDTMSVGHVPASGMYIVETTSTIGVRVGKVIVK